jgi:hypothetical protein
LGNNPKGKWSGSHCEEQGGPSYLRNVGRKCHHLGRQSDLSGRLVMINGRKRKELQTKEVQERRGFTNDWELQRALAGAWGFRRGSSESKRAERGTWSFQFPSVRAWLPRVTCRLAGYPKTRSGMT